MLLFFQWFWNNAYLHMTSRKHITKTPILEKKTSFEPDLCESRKFSYFLTVFTRKQYQKPHRPPPTQSTDTVFSVFLPQRSSETKKNTGILNSKQWVWQDHFNSVSMCSGQCPSRYIQCLCSSLKFYLTMK